VGRFVLRKKFAKKIADDNVNLKIHKIKQLIQSKEYDCFIKVDIEAFYPSIDHKILLEKVEKDVQDEEALYLLKKALTQITIPEGRRTDKNNHIESKGVAQGLSISNILSSIYMKDLDKKYNANKNLTYFRFVDDILILCKASDVQSIKTTISQDAEALKLKVHNFEKNSHKSSSGDIYKDTFQFLGFEFRGNHVSIRESSLDKLRERIIKVFYSNKIKSTKKLYRELNLTITGCVYNEKQYGWMFFFQQIEDQKILYSLDSFVKKQFVRFNRKYKEKKVKKFIKVYFFLKSYDKEKLNKKTYIPKFSQESIGKDKFIIKKMIGERNFYHLVA